MIIESIFQNQKPIPIQYTCDGDDISPPLKFQGIPSHAKSLVLIVDDPDAPRGTFDHWIVWNIPPHIQSLSESAKELFEEERTIKQGLNDFKELSYRGPCPPAGKPHRYFFKLYALDTLLNLEEGASKQEVEKAMQGHILDQTALVGTYQRKKEE